MAEIKKKKTTELKHRESQLIKALQLPQGYNNPIISFAQTSPSGGQAEQVLPIAPDAWARAAKGAGTLHKFLRNGLVGVSRFSFVILTEDKEDTGETVVGVHCIPVRNYLGADYSLDVGHPVTRESAVVQIHEKTGEIDIVAFPAEFGRAINDFLKKLESLDTIDSFTEFKIDNIQFTVMNIYGTEVTFRCIRQQH